jgi:hypothetical protein
VEGSLTNVASLSGAQKAAMENMLANPLSRPEPASSVRPPLHVHEPSSPAANLLCVSPKNKPASPANKEFGCQLMQCLHACVYVYVCMCVCVRIHVCVCVCDTSVCVCVCVTRVYGKSILTVSFTLVHLTIQTRISRGERGAQAAFVIPSSEQTKSYVFH